MAQIIFNSTRYMTWLAVVYGAHMMLGFWEPSHLGQPSDEIVHGAPKTWFVAAVDFCCVSAYGLDCIMQVYVAGWHDFYSRGSSKLQMALVALMAVNIFVGPPFGRYARPALVMVRHTRIRTECGKPMDCVSWRAPSPVCALNMLCCCQWVTIILPNVQE